MTQTLPGSTPHPTSQTAPNPPIPRLGMATVWDLDPQAIPATFTLDLDADDPAALLTALQNFADHTTDPARSDAALLAAEVVRTRMNHPLTIHQILQPLLDPVGIWPVTITITPHGTDRLELTFDTPDICRCAAQHLRQLGYILEAIDPGQHEALSVMVHCS